MSFCHDPATFSNISDVLSFCVARRGECTGELFVYGAQRSITTTNHFSGADDELEICQIGLPLCTSDLVKSFPMIGNLNDAPAFCETICENPQVLSDRTTDFLHTAFFLSIDTVVRDDILSSPCHDLNKRIVYSLKNGVVQPISSKVKVETRPRSNHVSFGKMSSYSPQSSSSSSSDNLSSSQSEDQLLQSSYKKKSDDISKTYGIVNDEKTGTFRPVVDELKRKLNQAHRPAAAVRPHDFSVHLSEESAITSTEEIVSRVEEVKEVKLKKFLSAVEKLMKHESPIQLLFTKDQLNGSDPSLRCNNPKMKLLDLAEKDSEKDSLCAKSHKCHSRIKIDDIDGKFDTFDLYFASSPVLDKNGLPINLGRYSFTLKRQTACRVGYPTCFDEITSEKSYLSHVVDFTKMKNKNNQGKPPTICELPCGHETTMIDNNDGFVAVAFNIGSRCEDGSFRKVAYLVPNITPLVAEDWAKVKDPKLGEVGTFERIEIASLQEKTVKLVVDAIKAEKIIE
eukprot:GDKK01011221.1.p1 GENE.GDKK01011221.1~~GDKK01011221.1.p1  ORF type:complete len:511 (+),score=83.95 GDKK01011221.1:61-1593(+)